MVAHVKHTVGVSPLVVVPCDDLDETFVECDSGLCIEDGRAGMSIEVLRDDLVLSVAKDPLHVGL